MIQQMRTMDNIFVIHHLVAISLLVMWHLESVSVKGGGGGGPFSHQVKDNNER
jgi:hypothetical protein